MEHTINLIPFIILLLLIFSFIKLSKKWGNKRKMKLIHVLITLSYTVPSICVLFTFNGYEALLGLVTLPLGMLVHLIINLVSIVHLNNIRELNQ